MSSMKKPKPYITVHFFFERKEVKDKLNKLLLDFALVKDHSNLRIGKLTTVSKQTNANYVIPEKLDTNAEHGFVENFCELFKLRDKLRSLRGEVEKKNIHFLILH